MRLGILRCLVLVIIMAPGFAAGPAGAAEPVDVVTADAGRLDAGSFYTCAIKTDGTPVCWGSNASGQSAPPAGVGPVTTISAGNGHTCAIKSDGSPVCWGDIYYGQTTVPAGVSTVTAIAAGGYHTCAIKSDGSPVCWGNGGSGQLSVPAGTMTAISAGGSHTCAIKSDGSPVCWGSNSSGQLVVPAGTVTAISSGSTHSCAIKGDGTPICWGSNTSGQSAVPAGIGTVRAITAGGSHTCAIKADGTPVCWGSNTSGQSAVPAGIGTVSAITAGGSHSCAIKADGTPTCWGSNSSGQAVVPAGVGTVGASPWAPALTGLLPGARASTTTPLVTGRSRTDTTVLVYAGLGCQGTPIGVGSAQALLGGGVQMTVPAESTTQLSARAIDGRQLVSACANASLIYTHVPEPPPPTTTVVTTPAPTPPPTTTTPAPAVIPPRPSGPTTRTITATDASARYALSGVPRSCVNARARLRLTMAAKRKSRRIVVKLARVDFYLGARRVKTDRATPFTQTIVIPRAARRGSRLTLRARGQIKVRHGKRRAKSIRTTITICR